MKFTFFQFKTIVPCLVIADLGKCLCLPINSLYIVKGQGLPGAFSSPG